MRTLRYFTFALLPLLLAGCGRKQITSLDRKQGASLSSEANFAVTVRDYKRAESLLAQAVVVCPDTPEYWLSLGTVRRKLDDRSGAKSAYEHSLDASRDAYKQSPDNSQALLQEVYLLAVLGKLDDARATLDKAVKAHPSDPALRDFVETKQLDRILADPGFKEQAL